MKIPADKRIYPISSAQKTLLWSEIFSLEPKKVKQNNIISFYMRVKKDCDINALEFAYNELIKNNDTLRLRLFRTLRGIKQYIKDFRYTKLERVKADGGLEVYLKEVNRYLVKFFDESLTWAQLVICGQGDCALVMRVHHAAIDGYSIRLIFEQLEKYYNAYLRDNDMEPEKSYSILKYFDMEERYLKSKQHKADRKFWLNQFIHQRKFSFPAGYRSEFGYCASEIMNIDKGTYSNLIDLAKETNCTLQFLLMTLAAFTTYVVTGKKNFCLFFASHGRINHSLKKTIGCMMNTIPIFYDLKPEMKIRDMLPQYYLMYLEMLSHGRLPLSELVPMSYYEAIKHFFNFNPAWLLFSSMEYGDFSEQSQYDMEMIRPVNQPNQFYLTMLDIGGERIDFDLSYQSRKFKPQTIRNLLKAYSFIIKSSVNHAGWSIGDIKNKYEEGMQS